MMRVDEKTHIVSFSTQDGREVAIATDDLDDLVRQPWFASFLGIASVQQVQQDKNAVAEELRAELRAIREQLNEERRTQVQPQSQPQQPQQPQQQPQQPQQQPQQPQQQGMNNFMDIQPSNMSDELWANLTQEQQQQYYQKYMS